MLPPLIKLTGTEPVQRLSIVGEKLSYEFLIDTTTAAAAVAGVVIAAVLGIKAVRVARLTVDRSALDYAAARIDLATEWRLKMFERMAELKAHLQVFWKEDPQELLRVDPSSPRAHELIAARQEAEGEVHKSIYLLQSAKTGLTETLPSVRVLVRQKGSDIEVGPQHLGRALAMAHLYERSIMPLYLSLVPEKRFSDPKIDPLAFKAEFMAELVGADASHDYLLAVSEASTWLDRQLDGPVDSQRTPEIIAINFIESFTEVEFVRAVRDLTDPVLALCRPVVAGGASSPAPAGARVA